MTILEKPLDGRGIGPSVKRFTQTLGPVLLPGRPMMIPPASEPIVKPARNSGTALAGLCFSPFL